MRKLAFGEIILVTVRPEGVMVRSQEAEKGRTGAGGVGRVRIEGRPDEDAV